MIAWAFLSLLTVTLVAATTKGPKVVHSPSGFFDFPEPKPRTNSPKIYFDALDAKTQKDKNEETSPPSLFDLLHGHLSNSHHQLAAIFPTVVQEPSGERRTTQNNFSHKFGVVTPTVKKCFGCHSWTDAFSKAFGHSFTKHIPSLDKNFIDNLPPNYNNSTSHVKTDDGSTTVVNQTVFKKTGDNFRHFYHIKVIHIFPNGSQEEREIDTADPEVIVPSFETTDPEVAVRRVDTADPEVVVPSLTPSSESRRRTSYKWRPANLKKRSVSDAFEGQRGIEFSPAHINRFPHSVSNRKDLTPVDGEKASRSWVYKNMAGKSYIYGITHNSKGKNEVIDNSLTRDVETSGAPKPIDLGSDLRVNPDGTENQGMIIAEPEAEVFNLTLLINEAESRANRN